MQFANLCPVSLEPITTENSFLIKVPAKSQENIREKDIYYYIADAETLGKLSFCPLSRRQGPYYSLKLSDISNINEILLNTKFNERLIDDNDVLIKVDKENALAWKKQEFKMVNNYQPETSLQDLLAFTETTHNFNPTLQSSTASIITSLGSHNNVPHSYTLTHSSHSERPVFVMNAQDSLNSAQQVNEFISAVNNMNPAPFLLLFGDNFYEPGSGTREGHTIDFDMGLRL